MWAICVRIHSDKCNVCIVVVRKGWSTHHQLIGDLGGHHAERHDVHRCVLGEEVLRRLLGNHQGGQHHQRERNAGREDTGALREHGSDSVSYHRSLGTLHACKVSPLYARGTTSNDWWVGWLWSTAHFARVTTNPGLCTQTIVNKNCFGFWCSGFSNFPSRHETFTLEGKLRLQIYLLHVLFTRSSAIGRVCGWVGCSVGCCGF